MSVIGGLVLRARSGFYTVMTDAGDLIEAHLRGRMKKERQASDIAVIGDRVSVEILPDGTGAIEAVEPRERRFSRRQPGPRGSWREDVMVANADLVVAVFAVEHPPPNPRLIDRFLVVADYNEVPALLVANKIDLVPTDAARALFEPYERIGYDLVYTSAKTGVGLEDLRARLAGRISIVTGPSGVGQVHAAERAPARPAAGDRRGLRRAPQGPSHDQGRRAAATRGAGARLRRRHPGHP